MKRKILPLAIAALAALSMNAFAAESYATISMSEEGKDGQIVSFNGYTDISGYNDAIAINTLWVELYESVDGQIDERVVYKNLWKGVSWNTKPFLGAAKYYIHLDPDGPNYDGCSGWGKAKQ